MLQEIYAFLQNCNEFKHNLAIIQCCNSASGQLGTAVICVQSSSVTCVTAVPPCAPLAWPMTVNLTASLLKDVLVGHCPVGSSWSWAIACSGKSGPSSSSWRWTWPRRRTAAIT